MSGTATAFGLHAAVEADVHRTAAAEGLPGLVASFGLVGLAIAFATDGAPEERSWEGPWGLLR